MSTPISTDLSQEALDWVLRSLDGAETIVSTRLLPGGISAKVCLLEVKGSLGMQSVVLRLFTNQEWNRQQPDLAKREAENLKQASYAQVATPERIAIDETGMHCGYPAVLMSVLPGHVELAPQDIDLWIHQLAEALVSLHQVQAPQHPWKYHTYNDVQALEVPAWSDFLYWDEVIRIVQGPRPAFEENFIHRDFHPTNVLWHDNQVSGVVDWVNACLGPHGIDVGHCRLNLAKLYGVETADRFLEAYQTLAGTSFTYDPYWDLLALIEGLPGPPSVYSGWTALGVTGLTDELMKERYEAYVASVLGRC